MFGRPRSQKQLVVAACALLVISVTAILSTVAGYRSRSQLESEIGHSLSEIAYQMADKLDRSMWARSSEIAVLSDIGALAEIHAPAALQKRLDNIKAKFPSLSWMGITDVNGKVVAATDGILTGTDISERPVFRNGRWGLFVGDVHDAVLLANLLPNPTGEPMKFVDIALPLTGAKGEPVGVLAAHLSWEWVREIEQSLLEPMQDRSRVDIFIVSTDGTVLLGPRETMGQSLKLDAVQRAQANANGWTVETWPGGMTYLTGFAFGDGHMRYKGLGWSVLVRQPLDAAYAPARTLQNEIVLTGAVLAILFAAAGWWIGIRITRPMERIATAAERMRQGEPGAAIPEITDTQEAQILSRSLRALVESLSSTQVALSRMEGIAYQDRLTSLPNRRFFEQYIETAVQKVRAEGGTLAFLYIDLDGFKPVNDWLGHKAGDEVLRQTALRLMAGLRGNDIIVRLGGDEFVGVLTSREVTVRSRALMAAQRLIDAVNEPILVEGETVTIGCSIGIAVWPSDGADPLEVMHRADETLYRAKAAGKNVAILYDAEVDTFQQVRNQG
ncbi:MAG TPA: diguanylate cyclase [Azospirillum sp.]|nr:diguanylate cyclase [Azospirillum sp.]